MKNAGTSIIGLWKFKEGVTYEKEDIIYYKGMLYVVVSGTYDGDELPNESIKCESLLESLRDSGKLITTSNLAGILHKVLDGVQLGGTISRIEINSTYELNTYVNNGIYSVRMKIAETGFTQNAFESILKVYRFSYGDTERVVQEIVDYSDQRAEGSNNWYPAVIWLRMGTYDENSNITWSGFNPIVSAYDNTAYGEWLHRLTELNRSITASSEELSTRLTPNSYYEVNSQNGAYYIDKAHSSLVMVVYEYAEGSEIYQDSFTYDVSMGAGKCMSVAGKLVTIELSDETTTDWVIRFNVRNVLKVIKLSK